MPPALYFLLRVALAIEDLLCFQISFGILFSIWEKCHWDFDGACIESVVHQ
jgi:hypothetical protein